MQDLNKLSFSISGNATQATSSLHSLIKTLGRLDTAFLNSSSSGKTFKTMLSSLSGANKKVTTSFKGVRKANGQVSTSLLKTKANMKGLARSTNVSTSANKKHTNSMGNMIRKLSQITFVLYALRTATRALTEGARQAIAYVENLNLFMVALGKNTTRASAFIKEMSSSLYLDEAQLTRVQGLFYQISESLGLSSERAYTLSTNFTKLAYDLASFYNITIESAVTKLQAGLVGETEPLRRIGIIITENNLAETARNMGITKSIRMMTEQEKIQLRYITALQQTRNAQGDLARTMEQPENLLRIIRERFHVLSREIGNTFIPMLKRIAPQVIGILMSLTKLASALATAMGYDAPEISNDLGGYMKTVADESDDISKSTLITSKNLAKALSYTRALSNATSGIDELNIMGESSASTIDGLFDLSAIEDVKTALDLPLSDYNNDMLEMADTFNKVIAKWDALFSKLNTTFKGVFDGATKAWNTLTGEIFGEVRLDDTLENTRFALDKIDDITTGMLEGVTNVVLKFKTLWNDYLKPMLESVTPDWLKTFTDSSLIDVIAKITEVFLIWKGLTIATGFVTSLMRLTGLSKIIPAPALLTFLALLGALKITFDVTELDSSAIFDKSKKALDNLFDTVFDGTKLSFGLEDMRTVLETVDEIGSGILRGIDGVLKVVKELWNNYLSPLLSKVAPDWLKNINDGTTSDTVALITASLLVWKGIVIAKSVLTALASLAVIALHAVALTGTLAVVLAIVKAYGDLFKDFKEIKEGGLLSYLGLTDFAQEVEDRVIQPIRDLFQSLEDGFNSIAYIFTFGLAGTPLPKKPDTRSDKEKELDPNLDQKVKTVMVNVVDALGLEEVKKVSDLGKIWNNILESILGSGSKALETIIESRVGLIDIPKMANGGTPQKGSLFIAGEAGAELVGDLGNGGTSVVNKKQMGSLGIPQFANGTNVPKWTIKEQQFVNGTNVPEWNSQEQFRAKKSGGAEDITKKINKVFDFVPNIVEKAFNGVTKFIKKDFKKLNPEMAEAGDVLIEKGANAFERVQIVGKNMFDGIKNSNAMKGAFEAFEKLSPVLKKLGKGFGVLGVGVLGLYESFKSDDIQAIMSSQPKGGGSSEQQQDIMGDLLSGMLSGTSMGMALDVMTSISEGMLGSFIDSLPMFIEAGIDMLINLIQGVVEALPKIAEAIPKVITKIVSLLTDPDSLNALIKGAIMIVVELVKALPDIIIALVKAVPTIIMALIKAFTDNIGLFAKLGLFIGLSIMDGIGNIIIGGINLILKGVNKLIPFTKWDIPMIPKMNTASVIKFADGGYPQEGQQFIAREAGAELVGNIGGKSGVMNNDQIVESVSKGVFEAVSLAMSQQGQKETVVNLNGKRVSERLDVVSRNRGLSFGMGGY